MNQKIDQDKLQNFKISKEDYQKLQFKNIFQLIENYSSDQLIYDFDVSQYNKVYLRNINQRFIIEIYEIVQIYQLTSKELGILQDNKFEHDQNEKIYILDLQVGKQILKKQLNPQIQIILSSFDDVSLFIRYEEQSSLRKLEFEIENNREDVNQSLLIAKLGLQIQDDWTLNKLKRMSNINQLRLQLEHYVIGIQFFDQFFRIITQHSNLENLYLNISFSQFDTEGMNRIGLLIADQKNLKVVDMILDGSSQDKKVCICGLLYGISLSPKIKEFAVQLQYNKFDHYQAYKIVAEICKFPSLKKLKIMFDQNEINTYYEYGLFSKIAEMINLTELNIDLQFNQIGNQFCSQKIEDIGKLQQLEVLNLNLGSNFLKEIECRSIGQGLSKLQNLKKLKFTLQYQQVDEVGINEILKGLSSCTNLSYLKLNLSQTQMGQQNLIDLIQIINSMTKLIQLILSLEFNQKLKKQDALLLSQNVRSHQSIIYFGFTIYVGSDSIQSMKKILFKKPRLVDCVVFSL